MPQINRIRVNNIKYNFKTQFYDDFLMRFSGKNAIYDLANGGGKSVLLLLMMQNMLPNCSLDEKQPVEKLFTEAGGSSVIHSLIEWKLDNCYVEDNYKYMTTGFCARKGKESVIEYFNYCIFYREFGDNDIKNLPLEEDGKRVTYQGLKTYLKELKNKDLGVKVFVFDKRNEYLRFITEYGIFESHWELVRGINKTEGHVRTYFETNYKKARKVVEDLLIEQIIEKSFNNRLGIEGEEENMAKTLFNIRSRLLELGQKKKKMDSYDNQCILLDEFAASMGDAAKLFEKRDSVKKELISGFAALKLRNEELEKSGTILLDKISAADDESLRYKRLLACAKIYDMADSVKEESAVLKSMEEEYTKADEEYLSLTNELKLCEAMFALLDYEDNELKKDAYVKSLESDKGSDDESTALKTLATTLKKKITDIMTGLRSELAGKKQKVSDDEALLHAARTKEKEDDRTLVVTVNKLEDVRKEMDILSNTYSTKRSMLDVTLDTDIKSMLAKEEALLTKLKASYDEALALKESSDQSLRSLLDKRISCMAAIEALDQVRKAAIRDGEEDKLDKLMHIYMADSVNELSNKIGEILSKTIASIAAIDRTIDDKLKTVECYRKRTLPVFDKDYKKVYEYLQANYEENVLHGFDWYESQPSNIRRDLIRRVPFITNSIVFCGDIELLKADAALNALVESEVIVPIVGENINYESRNAIGCDNVVMNMKDISFIWDEDKRNDKIQLIEEEIKEAKKERESYLGRKQVLEDDLKEAVVLSKGADNGADATASIEEKRTELKSLEEALLNLKEENTLHVSDLASKEGEYTKQLEKVGVLHESIELGDKLEELSASYEALRASSVRLKRDLENSGRVIKESEASIEVMKQECALCEKKLDEYTRVLRDEVSAYVSDDAAIDPVYEELSYTEIYAKFKVHKEIVEERNSDLKDRQRLIGIYTENMKKQKEQIEYLGFSVEELQNLDRRDIKSRDNLVAMKQKLEKKNGDRKALMKNIEGKKESLSYLKGSYENALASYSEEFKTDVLDKREACIVNKDDYTELVKKSEIAKKEWLKKIGENKNEAARLSVVRKSLVRHLGDCLDDKGELLNNLTVDESYDIKNLEKDIESYEGAERDLNRAANSFYRSKMKLRDGLVLWDAAELAKTVETSLNFAGSLEELKNLLENISSAKEIIQLEKNNVQNNIEDMLALKDAFENRCLNTCENIKASLERLAMSSKITLDDKVIPVIKLNIPYVSDDIKHERMSSYIDDIVMMCQSFGDDEDRFKFIRDKLTWKKLFSVVVTDMNDIRLSLYKRERNASQSRYLKYEEAVGSTGQSQGIYIQFLIAIINYIATINAGAKGEGIVGSTIFIDNPFGAAKDIYIWEPIFKLLKANHVQLIVPARGATPAITGRFEINYILGQVKQDEMLQTVVTDFRTQIREESVEYEKLEFEQADMFDMLKHL